MEESMNYLLRVPFLERHCFPIPKEKDAVSTESASLGFSNPVQPFSIFQGDGVDFFQAQAPDF